MNGGIDIMMQQYNMQETRRYFFQQRERESIYLTIVSREVFYIKWDITLFTLIYLSLFLSIDSIPLIADVC